MPSSFKYIKKAHLIFCLFYFILVLTCSYSRAQDIKENCSKAVLLIKVLEKYHYKPADLNEEWTSKFLIRFIQNLDPNNTFFLETDYSTIKNNKDIKQILSDKECTFLTGINKIYHQRLKEADSILSEINKNKLNLLVKDSITFFYNDLRVNFAKDKPALKKRWEKWIKYNVLALIYNEDSSITSENEILKNVPDALQKVITKERNKIERVLKYPLGFENFVSDVFYNALATGYDPHTLYFSYDDKKYFESSLSKESLSFGIELEVNNNGDILVDHLVPGGPAWKSGKLNKGDILIKLQWDKDKPINLYNLNFYDVIKIINARNEGKLEFTAKKSNGKVISVKLVKEKLEVEENVISGHILNGNKKIGYISLPAFYTETENYQGKGLSNDVAKEIIKLKKEKIEGLILDLRYNSGGSISEAMDLAGIFIDEGPLAISKFRDSKPITLKDFNRGIMYDGPLLLMVNSQSASASELFAASLQDYNRAIIVGNKTFGKATGQNIFPLDTSLNPKKESTDFVKITISKLYRVSGKSCQLKGVVPDINLPDGLAAFNFGESSSDAALPSDSVNKKVYFYPLPKLPVSELAINSSKRIEANNRFKKLLHLNGYFTETVKHGRTIPLEIGSYVKYKKMFDDFFSAIDSLPENPSKDFTVENPALNVQVLNYDSYRKEIDEVSKKNIHNDIYINESYKILEDLINLTYKNK